MNLENKTILITGGTGSLGKALTSHIFRNHNNILPLIIFIPFFGILLTGQLFDQKVIWFFMACLTQTTKISISNE